MTHRKINLPVFVGNLLVVIALFFLLTTQKAAAQTNYYSCGESNVTPGACITNNFCSNFYEPDNACPCIYDGTFCSVDITNVYCSGIKLGTNKYSCKLTQTCTPNGATCTTANQCCDSSVSDCVDTDNNGTRECCTINGQVPTGGATACCSDYTNNYGVCDTKPCTQLGYQVPTGGTADNCCDRKGANINNVKIDSLGFCRVIGLGTGELPPGEDPRYCSSGCTYPSSTGARCASSSSTPGASCIPVGTTFPILLPENPENPGQVVGRSCTVGNPCPTDYMCQNGECRIKLGKTGCTSDAQCESIVQGVSGIDWGFCNGGTCGIYVPSTSDLNILSSKVTNLGQYWNFLNLGECDVRGGCSGAAKCIDPNGIGEYICAIVNPDGTVNVDAMNQILGMVNTNWNAVVEALQDIIGGGDGSFLGGFNLNFDGLVVKSQLGEIPSMGNNAFKMIVEWFMYICLGVGGAISVLSIIYGAYLIMFSGGDPYKIKEGKEILTAAIAGFLFVGLSTALIRILGGSVLRIF